MKSISNVILYYFGLELLSGHLVIGMSQCVRRGRGRRTGGRGWTTDYVGLGV